MTMIKKLIFLSILYLLSFSNLHAKNIEDLIGKTIKISWDGSELKCNYTFFPWKQFASNCTDKKYLTYKIETFKDSGQKYIWLGSYIFGGKSYSEFFYFNDGGDLKNALKANKEGAKWDHTIPKVEINEIDYNDSEITKKKEYDFIIGIIDLAIYLEKTVDNTNDNTISSHTVCKNNLPEGITSKLGSSPELIVALKDFPKFSKIAKSKKGVNSLVKFGEKFMADAMSGVEKDPSEYKVPREFRSVKKNFMTLYGMYIGTVMQCAFAGL